MTRYCAAAAALGVPRNDRAVSVDQERLKLTASRGQRAEADLFDH